MQWHEQGGQWSATILEGLESNFKIYHAVLAGALQTSFQDRGLFPLLEAFLSQGACARSCKSHLEVI